MANLNYSFFEEFARLEQLCKDSYSEEHGVTKYIEEMKNTSHCNCSCIPN